MKYIILIALLLVLVSCNNINTKEDKVAAEMKPITLIADDNVKLDASYWKGNNKGVILLHMLGNDKSSWQDFPDMLSKEGFSVISIDFRGHGNSDLDYNQFTDVDWNNLQLDIKAAADYLKEHKAGEISIVGASIGANSALNYAADDFAVKRLALLSPGMTYRNIHTSEAMSRYHFKVLLVATQGDEYSFQSLNKLSGINVQSVIWTFSGTEHGTELLSKGDFKQNLVGWLKE